MHESPDIAPDAYAAASPVALLPCPVRLIVVAGDADTDVPAHMARAEIAPRSCVRGAPDAPSPRGR